ncbi:MAG: fused MFS/spermidine synthase, partial [Thermodesulfobacteriota bacterium]
MKIPTLKISLFVMGLSSITAQIILLRELLVSFLGNELTLGIILASWLILVAAGSFLIGKSVENVERKLEIFAVFQLIFSIAFPFAIFFCRIFKNILLATPGEALGFGPIFYSSLLILLPLTVPYGALFTYGCKLYAQYSEENAASIGKVYIIETMGSMIGGLLITFLLIQYLNPFTIAFSISLLNSLMALFLLWRNPASSKTSSQKALIILSILLSLLFAYGLLPQNT